MTHDNEQRQQTLPQRGKRGPRPGSEAAKRGGQALMAKHGREHMRAMGKAGSAKLLRERGREHMAEIGARGGHALVEHYGREHMADVRAQRRTYTTHGRGQRQTTGEDGE